MKRFRELRLVCSGNKRAAQFWRENLRKVVHREVMQALLFDQRDYMKRLRSNGGAPDMLSSEGIAILNGTFDSVIAAKLGLLSLKSDEVTAVFPRTKQEWEMMRDAKVIGSEWTD